MKIVLVAGLALVVTASLARADTMRTEFTKENRLPRQFQLELGANAGLAEAKGGKEALALGEANVWGVTPYARFGLFDSWAVYARLPVQRIAPKLGSGHSGIGDMSIGTEYRLFEDYFTYPILLDWPESSMLSTLDRAWFHPFLLPFAEYYFATGNEDKGLGAGDPSARIGLSMGSRFQDIVQFVLEPSYQVYNNQDNIPAVGLSAILDLSQQVSLLGEVLWKSVTDNQGSRVNRFYYQGGFTVEPARTLLVGFYLGSGVDTPEDVLASIKVAYTFF